MRKSTPKVITKLITPHSLANIIIETSEGLLYKRFQRRLKCYAKIDFKILEEDGFLNIQITRFGIWGKLNLKAILRNAIKDYVNIKEFKQKFVIATIQKKLNNTFEMEKLVCYKKLRLQIINDKTQKSMREFSSLKFYISVNLLLKIRDTELSEFSPTLLNYFKQIEEVDANIKISYRKNAQYIYRNHVRMDDTILCCKILSCSLTQIFQNSKGENFKKDALSLLGIKNPNNFENTIGCLLLSQVDKNYKEPSLKRKKDNNDNDNNTKEANSY